MTTIDDVTKSLAKATVSPKFELSFKGKGLKLNTAADAKEIVQAIKKCDHLTALRLEGNTVGVDAAEEIAKALGHHPEFERAHWSDMFTGRLKTEIPIALKHLGAAIIGAKCRLVEIDLSDNAFGPNGVVGLIDLLKSESCYSLQELRLNNNGLGIGGGKMLADCLTECHKSSVAAGQPLSLKIFISGRNRLENEGATALAAAFKAIGTLEFLAMPQNGINHPGISALADAIAANPKLKHLNLNDNTFTAKGAEAIAKALPKVENLEVINFGDCLIRTEGAKAIADVLRNSHKNLKELILSGNEINKTGAIDIIESLETKEFLEKLDLDANNFGEEGCEDIKCMVESLGFKDVLGSLSGDEGSDDEEDGEDENEEDEEEEPEEDEEGDISTDVKLQVKGTAITPSKPQITAKDFLAFPSPTKLLQLGNSGADSLLQELGTNAKEAEKVAEMFTKVSVVVSKEDEAKAKACELADKLLQNLLNQDPNAGVKVANAILVCLGLLKGEDKKYKPPAKIDGALLVLDHVVRQSYFPKLARDIIQIFVSKPHPTLDKIPEIRHKLLQTLYAF
ncbi:ran GTPase-activating protein 1-like isoform X1 [Biomphalaria glabrata]|uniref:Ran GTPase-activating protein 1-like isoform X1 n=1 Tax=Biomphalaria glabrata TaxID=6526 RepID=A0A9U8EEH0_BIOGL|nr:ran GTPase-activating protein 1-like isoform X1 [Biomphalaria glabrata]KAI8757140.1 ran GTPase-activating protein 1-like isoform X1 [Biomphalaria glabrata]